MFAGLFSSTKNKTKTILLVDVGSGSVGAGLGRLNSKGKPILLYSKREALPVSFTRSGKELQSGVLKAAKVAIEDVRKVSALWSEGTAIVPQKIEHIAFFLAAPWSTIALKSVHFSRSKPFKMSTSVLERMLTEENKISAEIASAMPLEIEKTAVSLWLNEYRAESLSDSLVTSVDVTLATTNSFLGIHDELQALARSFPGSPAITFHSFGLPASHALLTLKPDIRDALLLDVGSEVTEILQIKNGSLVSRATAPVGSSLYVRTLRTHANMSGAEADSALKLAQNDGTRLSQELAVPLTDVGKIWLKGLSQALIPLADNGLPIEIYVLADARVQSWIQSSIELNGMPDVYRNVVPKVTRLDEKEFRAGVDVKAEAGDAFLMAELLFSDSRLDAGSSISLLSTREPLLLRRHDTIE